MENVKGFLGFTTEKTEPKEKVVYQGNMKLEIDTTSYVLGSDGWCLKPCYPECWRIKNASSKVYRVLLCCL